jgi:putative zinc finger protein
MPHLDEGTLHALLDGEIPSAELPPIQAHLHGCAECRARLAEEQDLLAESDRLIEALELPEAAPAVVPVRNPSRRVWPTRLAWAATVVLAAGLGYSARGGPAEPPPARSRDSGVELRADEPAASPAPPTPKPESVSPRRDQALAPKLGATAPPPADARRGKAAAGNAAPAEEKAEQRAVAADTSAQPPAPPVAQPQSRPAAPTSAVGRVGALRQEGTRLREVAPAGTLADRAAFAVAQPATLPEAMRVLGGSLRLIDGMIPERLEILGGNTVRVVYRTGFGELLLSQELQDGTVRFTLIGPRGFPADSLERLRARVRE